MKKIIALTTLLLIGLAALLVSLPHWSNPQEIAHPAERKVVLLVPQGFRATLPDDTLINESTTIIVHDVDALVATYAHQRPLAIVIERSLLPTVGDDWLTAQYKMGIPVAGIDIQANDLKAKLGLPDNGYQIPPFIEPPYLLYIYHRAASGLTAKGGGVVPLSDYAAFLNVIKQSEQSFQSQLP